MLIYKKADYQTAVKYFQATLAETQKQLPDDMPKEAILNEFVLSFDRLLPNSAISPENNILVAFDKNGEEIGYLWTKAEYDKHYLLIADIFVNEQSRGKGYATQMLNEAEKEAKKLRLPIVALSVVKGNDTAKACYKKNGYVVVSDQSYSYTMIKKVEE